MQSDPIGLPGGLATFGYTGQSPLGYFDRFGEAKRGRKTKEEGGPHNDLLSFLGACLIALGHTIIAGGGEKPEQARPTIGGNKPYRRPDIIFRVKGCELECAINVGWTAPDGKPLPREVKAMDDLNIKAKIPTFFAPCGCVTDQRKQQGKNK